MTVDKLCSVCKTVKPISEFAKYQRAPDGYQYSCRICQREYYWKHRSKNTKTDKWGRNHFETTEQHFWSQVDKDGPVSNYRPDLGNCWVWIGYVDKQTGYAKYKKTGRSRSSHQVAYEYLIGPVPEGLQLDHLCRVRHCVNPAHLEPVTGKINTLRGTSFSAKNAAKTHCKNGHPLSGNNLCTYYTKRCV